MVYSPQLQQTFSSLTLQMCVVSIASAPEDLFIRKGNTLIHKANLHCNS